MSRALLVLVCVAGCGESKKQKQPAPKPEPEAVVAKDAAAPASKPSRPKPNKPPALAPEKRAEYKQHLKAGRKLARDKKWKEASAEFELALKVIPEDGRALSELGWTAFQAKDYEQARKANLLSVRVAGDDQVKAASLYNLGRVAEATGDKTAAAEAYKRSVKLRPNATVENRLASLEAPAPAGDDECKQPILTEKVCGCVSNEEALEPDMEFECSFDPEPASKYEVLELDANTVTMTVMLALRGGGWVEFASGEPTFSGSSGINESYFASIEVRKVKGHDVLWITGESHRTDYDLGINEYEESSGESLQICVVPKQDSEPIVCPIELVVHATYKRALVEEEDGYDEDGELEGEPVEGSSETKVTLTDDGTLVVEHVSGGVDAAENKLIGKHDLFELADRAAKARAR